MQVVALPPVLPGQLLRVAVVVDQQLLFGVDGVAAVGERELHELRLGDGLGRARLDAEVAVDAPQEVDLVDVAVALPGGDRVVGRVVESADIDAVGRTHPRAELAADALLHPVLVTVEDVATVLARLLHLLLFRVLAGDRQSPQVLEGELEPSEEVLALARRLGHRHQLSPPFVVGPAGGVSSGRTQSRTPTGGSTERASSRTDPIANARRSITAAATTTAAIAMPHHPSTTNPATMSSHPSESGMSRVHPRSMSWS